MAKKASKKSTTKEEVELKTVKKDGWNVVTMTSGVEFWTPKKEGDSVEGDYMETLEFPNKGIYANNKPVQFKPIIKTKAGVQIAVPDNFKIHQAIKQFGKKYYRFTYLGQTAGTGEHKGKKFNNFEIAHK